MIIILGILIYKVLAPPKHGIRSQLVQNSNRKKLQPKAR